MTCWPAHERLYECLRLSSFPPIRAHLSPGEEDIDLTMAVQTKTRKLEDRAIHLPRCVDSEYSLTWNLWTDLGRNNHTNKQTKQKIGSAEDLPVSTITSIRSMLLAKASLRLM